MTKKYISFDIDGVLNDYPLCWLKFIEDEVGIRFNNTADAKNKLGNLYYEIKSKYRNSKYKFNLPISNEALSLHADLVNKGYGIVISTSRPINDQLYPNLRSNTEDWLRKKGFHFDVLLYKMSEVLESNILTDIIFHVDDEQKFVDEFKKNGVHAYHLCRNGPNYGNRIICLTDLIVRGDVDVF